MSANCNVSLPCAVAAPHAVSSSELGEPCPVSCHDANAILTTENLEQAVARQTDKGRDAARVAVEMARLTATLS